MADEKALMNKFNGVLAAVRQEIVAVRKQYAGTPGPHLSEADWSCVEQDARAYVWRYLTTRGLDAPALVPGTVVQIALSNFALVAGDTKELMDRFYKLNSAAEEAAKAIQAKSPHLTSEEIIDLAMRQVAAKYPLDFPVGMMPTNGPIQ